MSSTSRFPYITLLLMISFASVNAVLFTPALPEIANFFGITDSTAQLTITIFLIGYALGQLIYGPIANRYGRKPALYSGIILQILSSLLCALAAVFQTYALLVVGRLLLALGSGVGLKMTFTLVNETQEPAMASQKLSYLMTAFAITPGLGVMLGGYLCAHFDWTSTFYAGAVYGLILLALATRLPETKNELDIDALKFNKLVNGYMAQFKNFRLMAGGLLMGSTTCFVYVFAAMAPFIAINLMHMDTSSYGEANLLPSIGLISGSFLSAQLSKIYNSSVIIKLGIAIAYIGSFLMFFLVTSHYSAVLSLFIPMAVCYFGLAMVFSHASGIAMASVSDKAYGAAVMSFTNMALVTVVVLSIGILPIKPLFLPIIYIAICVFMTALNKFAFKEASV